MFYELRIIIQILSPSILTGSFLHYYNSNNINIKNTNFTKKEQMLFMYYSSSV